MRLVSPDGSEVRDIAPGAAAVTLGVWSPGGRQLGVTVFPEGAGDGQACLIDLRDGTSTVLAAGPAARVCAVSGDGRRAVVRLGRRGARHLELVDLWSGRRTELLPGGDANDGRRPVRRHRPAAVRAHRRRPGTARRCSRSPCAAAPRCPACTPMAERPTTISTWSPSTRAGCAPRWSGTWPGAARSSCWTCAAGCSTPVEPAPGEVVDRGRVHPRRARAAGRRAGPDGAARG